MHLSQSTSMVKKSMNWTRLLPAGYSEKSYSTKQAGWAMTRMTLGTLHETLRTPPMPSEHTTRITRKDHPHRNDLKNGHATLKRKRLTLTTQMITNQLR